MEEQIQKKEQPGMSLQKLSQNSVIEKDGQVFVSIYSGGLTQKEIAKNMARLKIAFPALQKDFYFLLGERIKEKVFSDDKFKDAVNHVIDNCKYPTPMIADFLSYDKIVKLYDYNEVTAMITAGKATFDDFEKREIDGKVYRIRKTDI